jgi:hypothetical protein
VKPGIRRSDALLAQIVLDVSAELGEPVDDPRYEQLASWLPHFDAHPSQRLVRHRGEGLGVPAENTHARGRGGQAPPGTGAGPAPPAARSVPTGDVPREPPYRETSIEQKVLPSEAHVVGIAAEDPAETRPT